MYPIDNVSEDIPKRLDKNDDIHGRHVHLARALSQCLQDNTDFNASVEEGFTNIAEAIEDFSFHKMN